MSEETSGEVRILGLIANLASDLKSLRDATEAHGDCAAVTKLAKELADVRTIVTSMRAADQGTLEIHEEELGKLKAQVSSHDKELTVLHDQMARVLRELTHGNLTAERNEKLLKKVDEKNERILALLEAK